MAGWTDNFIHGNPLGTYAPLPYFRQSS